MLVLYKEYVDYATNIVIIILAELCDYNLYE